MSLHPKQPVPDCEYLLSQAVQEADLALRAELARGPRHAEAHHRKASTYLDLLFGEGAPESERCDEERAECGPS